MLRSLSWCIRGLLFATLRVDRRGAQRGGAPLTRQLPRVEIWPSLLRQWGELLCRPQHLRTDCYGAQSYVTALSMKLLADIQQAIRSHPKSDMKTREPTRSKSLLSWAMFGL